MRAFSTSLTHPRLRVSSGISFQVPRPRPPPTGIRQTGPLLIASTSSSAGPGNLFFILSLQRLFYSYSEDIHLACALLLPSDFARHGYPRIEPNHGHNPTSSRPLYLAFGILWCCDAWDLSNISNPQRRNGPYTYDSLAPCANAVVDFFAKYVALLRSDESVCWLNGHARLCKSSLLEIRS